MRIISLVPAETELLCDLGLEDQLVGVTESCIHPYYIQQKKTVIGSPKSINFDALKELQPDIILCSNEINSDDIIEQCKQICEVNTSVIKTIDDVLELISEFGILFNCRTESDKILQKLKFKFKDFMFFIKGKDWQKVAYFIKANPWEVIGGNTFVNHLLELNNFQNIYKDKGNLSKVKINKIRLEGDPDCVFLSSNYNFSDENAFELGRFTHHSKTVFVDDTMFSWGGSRLLKAFEYFKKIHTRIGDAVDHHHH